MSNVSDAEKESFFWYSKSKNAIPLNKRMRNLQTSLTDEQYTHYKNMMTSLYKNLSKNPITVYRGLENLTTEKVREMLNKPHLAFFSTTKVKQYDYYTTPYIGCCLLEINVPKNSPIVDISTFSKYKDEEEVVLAPGKLIYKAEYDQKLENYMGDIYMKVYQCEYKPFRRYKVKVENVKKCLEKYLKKYLKKELKKDLTISQLDFMIKKIFYKV